MSEVTYRYCSTCSQEQAFETPECLDGHGADCPELACVDCGAALWVGGITTSVERAPVGVSAAA